MANPILDALEYVGESLDKPGAAVRGVLGGDPTRSTGWVPACSARRAGRGRQPPNPTRPEKLCWPRERCPKKSPSVPRTPPGLGRTWDNDP